MEKQGNLPPPYTAQPPPPAGFVPPPQAHPHPPPTSTVVITHSVNVGPLPQRMICPSCHADIQTKVENEPSTKTHLFALILCLFGCYLCCCCPYCIDSCQSQRHNCPNCNAYIGTHNN